MRITNKMITAKYIRSINTISEILINLTHRLPRQSILKSIREYFRAVKAFQIRRDLSKAEGYQLNIAHAKSTLINTESTLNHINELIQNAKEKILAAKQELRAMMRENCCYRASKHSGSVLQTLNSNASEYTISEEQIRILLHSL